MTESKTKRPTVPFDPFAMAKSAGDFAWGLAAKPAELLEVQLAATRQWGEFWTSALRPPADPPRDRRFAAPEWSADPYYRAIRDSYLLASQQLRELVARGGGDGQSKATASFLLDQYLNAVSPTNFAATNPAVIQRIQETKGKNLVEGFANLLEDVSSGKGIVQRRSDPSAFVKGETIAATPGQVVFENDLFQLIQYTPVTAKVAAEPLLYVPPLVNRYYMIDLRPKSSLVKWLVDQGRTVFVVSWVNPTEAHRDKDVAAYVTEGVVTAIEQVRKRTKQAPDLFSFCLGGTLVAIALAWLAAKGRAQDVNSATLIGSMVDFADMRDWSAFVHEGHLGALEDHLEAQGFIDSVELQRLFAAMRANDLIWSSVVQHYLLAQPAPPSDLLTWFEDGARIPAAFLKSYNRDLLLNNSLKEPAGFKVGYVAIDLAAIETPMLVIALKDDHVSAWSAVYDGARLLKADFVLGGSGHNAGVINPPAAGKHGFWTNDARPQAAEDWLAGATKHDGSWWPHWTQWLARHGSGKQVAARAISDGLEPAPGRYAMMP
ncbi:class I poly(R)-hydroxyalkanoic acid synthase [Sphingomonas sp.]|uniref:PHA/PHB synthase family protein n=1 Tax=Sphingomonas sp. TaxID=28214 RepID=UPI00286DBDCC|nr:class I poly(R)-hydroxyalkanoic acid synthase [Sphingomonas sp.]